MSTPTQPQNTYDLQIELWALKEELEDAKEIIDTNFARVASQAAQIHRLRHEIRTKNQLLDDAHKTHSTKLAETEAEIASLKTALKQKDEDIKLKLTVANRGFQELLDAVEYNPPLHGTNTTHPLPISPSHPPPRTIAKRNAATQAADSPTSDTVPQLTHAPPPPPPPPPRTTSTLQMNQRLAPLPNPPPPPHFSTTHAIQPAKHTSLHNPKRCRPQGSKRAKLSSSSSAGLIQAHIELSPPETAQGVASSTMVATALDLFSEVFVLRNGVEESKPEQETIVPRRGLRVKRGAKGRGAV
ncbi:MAG: hypothetical protein Q9184_002490 [Pyrenodesmia sp. 2 TL-2023]